MFSLPNASAKDHCIVAEADVVWSISDAHGPFSVPQGGPFSPRLVDSPLRNGNKLQGSVLRGAAERPELSLGVFR